MLGTNAFPLTRNVTSKIKVVLACLPGAGVGEVKAGKVSSRAGPTSQALAGSQAWVLVEEMLWHPRYPKKKVRGLRLRQPDPVFLCCPGPVPRQGLHQGEMEMKGLEAVSEG